MLYVYAIEVERRRWDIVLAGLAFWLVDWVNEIVNALILHFSDKAPLWAVTGDTSYLILIGLTIEISFMFAISGIVYVKTLPRDPRCGSSACRTGSSSGSLFSCLAVFVELLLHAAGVFHWEYWWWNVPFVPLIVLFGYLWFFLVAAYVYDMATPRRQARFVAAMAARLVLLCSFSGRCSSGSEPLIRNLRARV